MSNETLEPTSSLASPSPDNRDTLHALFGLINDSPPEKGNDQKPGGTTPTSPPPPVICDPKPAPPDPKPAPPDPTPAPPDLKPAPPGTTPAPPGTTPVPPPQTVNGLQSIQESVNKAKNAQKAAENAQQAAEETKRQIEEVLSQLQIALEKVKKRPGGASKPSNPQISQTIDCFKRHKFKFLLGAIALVPLLFLLYKWLFPPPPKPPCPPSSGSNSTFFGESCLPRRSIYVNPISGNDENSDGSAIAPFKTLPRAIKDAKPGSTVYLADGNHVINKKITIPEDVTVINQPSSNFKDIEGHWAADFIRALAAKGLVVGYPDGRFGPNDKLTRAEYATLLRKVFNLTPQGQTKTFSDIRNEFWAYKDIQTAYQSGFLKGFPEGNFRPDDPAQRVQVISALISGQKNLAPAPLDQLNHYQDRTQIPPWARSQVATATANKMVANYPQPQQLRPTIPATRAEAAVMIYQTLGKQSQMPEIKSPYLMKP